MFNTRHIVSFFVRGEPAPGGSKNAFVPTDKNGNPYRRENGGIVVNVVDAGGKANKVWRKAVGWTGKGKFHGQLLTGALEVKYTFYMPRPKAHFGTGKNASILKADAPEFHLQKPDALKLMRACEDALTGVVWVDDCTTIEAVTRKLWNTDNEIAAHYHHPGCLIEISEILSRREQPQELLLTLPPACPPPISTPTQTTATTETSIGFDATKPDDAPW